MTHRRRTTLPRYAQAFPALLLAMALVVVGCGKGDNKNRAKSPALAVTVVDVVAMAVPLEIRTFGTVDASATVAVKAQIGGVLTNRHFQEGQDVKRGDLLLSIDSRAAEAALKQAEANRARDAIQQKNAEIEAGRQEELFKKGLTSQDVRDQARTTADALAAAVKGDDAQVETARLELDYCSIRAPLDGRTGRLMVDVGNVVKADDLTLVTINQVRPVYVRFAVPQDELPAIRKHMAGASLPLQAVIPGEPGRPESGALTFVDNAVDKNTGTIQVRGTFTNDSARLWPGQFVSVILTLAVQHDAIIVPSAAVQTGQKGTYVFVVKPDMTAENRPITVDRAYSDKTVVSAGIAVGERVVTDGQFRMGPGARVEIKSATPKSPGTQP